MMFYRKNEDNRNKYVWLAFFGFVPDTSETCLQRTPTTGATQSSGVFLFQSDSQSFHAYCDRHSDCGGWVVIQRRQDGSVNFNRNWRDYKHGFGELDSEFWLGNEKIHKLTSQGYHTLRIDITFERDATSRNYQQLCCWE